MKENLKSSANEMAVTPMGKLQIIPCHVVYTPRDFTWWTRVKKMGGAAAKLLHGPSR